MASTIRKFDWLVVIPDTSHPETPAKRVQIRQQHVEGAKKYKESGFVKIAGAILEDIPVHDDMASWNVAGSTIVVSAQSREAIIEQLQSDVYATEGVWDLSKAMIWPAAIGYSVAIP